MYNADNKPLTISLDGTPFNVYTYDGEGVRAYKKVNNIETFYFNDKYEKRAGDNIKYIFANNLRIARIDNQDVKFYHKNHLGSSMQMSREDGTSTGRVNYMPFGEQRNMADNTDPDHMNYKYTDQEQDIETGLYNYHARLYDPALRMFITPDSIVPDWYEPQSLNRYAYCRNNPMSYIDPNGEEPISITVIGTVALCSIALDYYSKWRASGQSFSNYYWSADYTIQRGLVVGGAGALSGGSGNLIAGTGVSLVKKMMTAALVDMSIDSNKRQILGDEITAGTIFSSASGGAMGQGFGSLFSKGLDSIMSKTKSSLIGAGLTRKLDAYGNLIPYTTWKTEISNAYLTGIVFGEMSGQLLNYNLGDNISQLNYFSIDWWGDKENKAWNYTLNDQFSDHNLKK